MFRSSPYQKIFFSDKQGPGKASGGKAWKDIQDAYRRLAKFVIPLGIACFGISRIAASLFNNNPREVLTVGILFGCTVLMIFLCHRLNRRFDPAILEPLVLYCQFILGRIITRDFTFFFSASFGLCCIAAAYLNVRRMRQFLAVLHLATAGLIIAMFRFPALGADGPEMIPRWVALIFSSTLLYLIMKFGVDQLNGSMRAEAYLKAVLAVTPDRVALLDSENRAAYISKAFTGFLNPENTQALTDRPVSELIREPSAREVFSDVLGNREIHQEIREITLDGDPCFFKIVSKNLPEEIKGRYINFSDITPEMTEKHKAESASQTKSAFLATMSHEIRTPLNAVIGLSEIELQKKLPEETLENLKKIYTSGSSLLGIINDMLDISKIEAGSFELVPVVYDVPGLIDDVIQLNIIRIASKNIDFELTIDETLPAKLFGDELRLKQIMSNLLSNAFKYTEEGKVRMDINWERQKDDAWLTIEVSDTGQGIKEEDIENIFSEYCQVDSRANRNIEGTGLGLPITKYLTEMMDGKISAESVYGQGSTFRVRVRQEIAGETPIGKETAETLMSFRFTKKRRNQGTNLIRTYMPYGTVLVVDDVPTNLDVVKGLLLPYGLGIDCAASGAEAVEKIRRAGEGKAAPYDLVFMDHMMPGMDGVEAVRIIRGTINSEYARTVPVIALTANALKGDREMFLANGFNGYISKPIDIMQLDTVLKTWIRNKQSEETLRQAEREEREKEEIPGPELLEKPHVPGIDWERGKEYYGTAGYLKIIRSFCSHTPKSLEKLRDFAGDSAGINPTFLPEYTTTVHGLKGSSYGICAEEAGFLAQSLESAARNGDISAIKEKNAAFISLMEKLTADLETLLKKLDQDQAEKKPADSPDQELLDDLLEACRGYDISQMEKTFAELDGYEYQNGMDLIRRLQTQMENFDYQAMAKTLENQN